MDAKGYFWAVWGTAKEEGSESIAGPDKIGNVIGDVALSLGYCLGFGNFSSNQLELWFSIHFGK